MLQKVKDVFSVVEVRGTSWCMCSLLWSMLGLSLVYFSRELNPSARVKIWTAQPQLILS